MARNEEINNDEKHQCLLHQSKGPKYPPNPSICCYFKRKLRNCTTIHSRHPDTKFLFRSEYQIQEERLRHIRYGLWLSIHPFSQFALWWRVFMCAIYLEVIIGDLALTTLRWDKEHFKLLKVITRICNDICIVDVLVNFFTGYMKKYKWRNVKHMYTEETFYQVELKRRKIIIHYLKTFFFVDILCLLSFAEQFYPGMYMEKRVMYYLLIIRLLRYARLYTVFTTIKKITPDEVYSILCCVFVFFFMIYFFACMHILVPRMIRFFKGKNREDHFAQKIRKIYVGLNQPMTDTIIFMHAMYESSLALFAAISFNPFEATSEAIFIYMANITFGMVFNIYAFVTILQIMKSREMPTLKYQAFSEEMKNFYRNKHLDDMTRKQVVTFLHDRFKQEFFDERTILSTVTKQMRYEIFLEDSMDLVRNCELFLDVHDDIVAFLSVRLNYETHMPGVKVISEGELATCMFFVASGTVAVYGKNEREICHLGDGAYFGEIGLLEAQTPKRVADVICIEYCQLYRLDKKDFLDVVKPDSKIAQRIIKRASSRLQERQSSLDQPTLRMYSALQKEMRNRKRTLSYIQDRKHTVDWV